MPQSRHVAAVYAVQAVIAGMNLPGLAASRVFTRLLPVDREITAAQLPCVVLSPAPEEEAFEEGLSSYQSWFRPVVVECVSASNAEFELTADVDAVLYWREQILLRFNRRPLSALTQVPRCVVEPGPICDPGLWQQANLFVSQLVIRPLMVDADL